MFHKLISFQNINKIHRYRMHIVSLIGTPCLVILLKTDDPGLLYQKSTVQGIDLTDIIISISIF